MAVYTEREFVVRYYDTDINKKIFPARLLNYFDDTVVYQTENDTPMTMDELAKRKFAWVLVQWEIDIVRYPQLNEKIIVWTKPTGFGNIYAGRQYGIKSSKGEELVKADAVWILIDAARRRPTKIPGFMLEAYDCHEGGFISDIRKFKFQESNDNVRHFTVRRTDIDNNNHVNNASYLEWAYESIADDWIENKRLKRICIQFKKEVFIKELISVSTFVFDENTIQQVIRNKNNEISALIESQWTK